MNDPRTILVDLALVLCVAGVTTVVFRRLRQPVVLGYLLAGVIVGPHLPVPLFADPVPVRMLAELGIVLVMFAIGLSFRIAKLVRLLATAGVTTLISVSLMVWLGSLAGRAFGWSDRESLFAGAVVAISSTVLVARTVAERPAGERLPRLLLGIALAEDAAGVLLLSLMTAVSTGAGVAAGSVLPAAVRLVVFLGALLAGGFLVVPRAVRLVARLGSGETLAVATIGLCFALALAAHEAGYSVALGAFVAGMLVAESGEADRIEPLVRPLRDIFGAVFFVAVGMAADPDAILRHAPEVLTLAAVVVVGKWVAISSGSFLAGNDLRTAMRAGMSLTHIGEFSFVIAGVGAAAAAVRPDFLPIVVAVAVVTTFVSPFLARAADPVAAFVDRSLPRPLQTFLSLYASWLESFRASPHTAGRWARSRRLVGLLAVDAAALAVVVIAAAIAARRLAAPAAETLGIPPLAVRAALASAALLVAAPFAVGVLRIARALGAAVAEAALPPVSGRLDLANAPRRALVVALQLVVVVVTGLPLLAVTQPFGSAPVVALALAVAVVSLAIVFWRRAANLQDHVRAGAQLVLASLTQQRGSSSSPTLHNVQSFLPGLGEVTPLRIAPGQAAVGRTLSELKLRGLTGATVIAILRGDQGVVVPSGHDLLRAGDLIAVVGTEDAVRAAERLLRGPGDALSDAGAAAETGSPIPSAPPSHAPRPAPPRASPAGRPPRSAKAEARPRKRGWSR